MKLAISYALAQSTKLSVVSNPPVQSIVVLPWCPTYDASG
jgi:hypothetical protein